MMLALSPESLLRREERHAARLERLRARVDRTSFRLATVRLVAALAGLAAFLLAWRLPGNDAGFGGLAIVSIVIYILAAWAHARPQRRAKLLAALLRLQACEVLRARGEWRSLPRDGARFAPACPFSEDLAVFGRGSAFQLVSRCATDFGEAHLASSLARGEAPADWRERQEAVRELARLRAFRMRLHAAGIAGREEGGTTGDLSRALGRSSIHDGRPWLHPLLLALVVATVLQGILEFGYDLPTLFWPTLLLQGLVFALTLRRVVAEYEELLGRERAFLAWSAMLREVEGRRFRTPRLEALRAELSAGGVTASQQLSRLQAVLTHLAIRHGSLHPVVNVAMLWDLHHVARLARLRRETAPHLSRWFAALGELEALASLAAHAASVQPEAKGQGAAVQEGAGGGCWPVLDAEGPVFATEDLRHVLLHASRAVGNDLLLPREGALVLLTGSNMSGKSTFLRTIGLAVVFAQAGGAVPAGSLRMRPLRLMTSIHISDALDEGVSLFHAEVLRLKSILDAVARPEGAPVLFLVDEILRGTNTKERLIASRSVIRHLAGTRAAGLVTSHDLSLADLESEVGALVNMHFRETVVDGQMSFDYKLRTGRVTTTNALRVLRAAGIEVDEG